MADRCASTVICTKADQRIFERLGYRLDASEASNAFGEEIPNAIVMVDEQAAGGHYDELTALKSAPYVASNSACIGVFSDHVIASDGTEWAYAEALAESNCPAVRVNPDGEVFLDDLATARSYWEVYERALNEFEERARDSSKARADKP